MIESEPALASACTAHMSAWEGASPGCQLSPWMLVSGATAATSCLNAASISLAVLAAGPSWAWLASTPTASIARSTPMPLVSLRMVSTGSSNS
ncbi:hypothetical protein D3C78_1520170 [compost metagenome]